MRRTSTQTKMFTKEENLYVRMVSTAHPNIYEIKTDQQSIVKRENDGVLCSCAGIYIVCNANEGIVMTK